VNPFPFVAVAMALLSRNDPDASLSGYVAAVGGAAGPLLALAASGDVVGVSTFSCDTTAYARIRVSSPFVSITRGADGSVFALTASGAAMRQPPPAIGVWRDCGLLSSPCPFVAIGTTGSGDRLLALNACGEVFLGQPVSGAWVLAGQIPDSTDRFVALGRDPSANVLALTRGGRLWRGTDGRDWRLVGELPPRYQPYAAFTGGTGDAPALALSEAGDVLEGGAEPGAWTFCSRVPASMGEAFRGIGRDELGFGFVLTSSGQLWRNASASHDCHLWTLCARLPVARATGALDGARAPRLALTPNPVKARALVVLTLAAPGRAQLDLLDVSGRVVRGLLDAPCPSGVATVLWDGNGDQGRRPSPGTYFLRLRSGGIEITQRLQVLR